MKLTKIIALVLAASVLCVGLAVPSFAESTPYEEAMARYEQMKGDYINVCIEYYGMYTTKASKFYAREVTGVAEDGSFILGPWRCLAEQSYVTTHNDSYFNIPATCVQFAYSFDIMWGTDWPFSRVFWTDVSKDVRGIRISLEGYVREASIVISVDGAVVVRDLDCDSHSEWRP